MIYTEGGNTREREMMTIEFVDELPPKQGGFGNNYLPDPIIKEFVTALRANPGRWAKYPVALSREQAFSLGGRIRAQRRPATPLIFLAKGGCYRATARAGQLYVCWIRGGK
jgi:hypothetical protein